MKSRTVASIKYIDASQLFSWMKRGSPTPFQVIDVRGSDYIGGHIREGWNYPYKKFGDSVPELLARLQEKRQSNSNDACINVVFHCAQSQQRGPSAAMKFLREIPDPDLDKFEVCVLRGGFNNWQDLYGEDSTVTEDYRPELWTW